MSCDTIQFSAHGLIKMTERRIDVEDVMEIVRTGTSIFAYPKDKPYPSRLVLGWVEKGSSKKALHVVVAEDIDHNSCIVVTAYWPDEAIWLKDFKTRK
jgi:hypothetical protein